MQFLKVRFPNDRRIPSNLRGKTVFVKYNVSDLFDAEILNEPAFYQNKELTGYAAKVARKKLQTGV